MSIPSIEWLKEAADGRLEVNPLNIWKTFRHRAYIQVIDQDGVIFENLPQRVKDRGLGVMVDGKFKRVTGFRITERGKKLISEASGPKKSQLKGVDTDQTRLWISSLKRWARNIPKGMELSYSEGELHVLAPDTDGKLKDDEDHRVISLDVPWHK